MSRTFTPEPSDAADVIARLRTLLDPLMITEPGAEPVESDTDYGRVYVASRHVSQSGMLRRLSLFAVNRETHQLEDITWSAAVAMNENVTEFRNHFTLTVRGAGMDMHFATVYSLSAKLFDAPYFLRHHSI